VFLVQGRGRSLVLYCTLLCGCASDTSHRRAISRHSIRTCSGQGKCNQATATKHGRLSSWEGFRTSTSPRHIRWMTATPSIPSYPYQPVSILGAANLPQRDSHRIISESLEGTGLERVRRASRRDRSDSCIATATTHLPHLPQGLAEEGKGWPRHRHMRNVKKRLVMSLGVAYVRTVAQAALAETYRQLSRSQ